MLGTKEVGDRLPVLSAEDAKTCGVGLCLLFIVIGNSK